MLCVLHLFSVSRTNNWEAGRDEARARPWLQMLYWTDCDQCWQFSLQMARRACRSKYKTYSVFEILLNPATSEETSCGMLLLEAARLVAH